MGRIFAAMGMHPTGYYDLRDASASAVPVVSTAFRPIDESDLAANPFRVFTSLLASTDRRFFAADLSARLKTFLAGRQLFPPRLLDTRRPGHRRRRTRRRGRRGFLALAAAAFALSDEAIDRTWYAELEQVSAVAADIGGVTSTHINHLTPRVLDIDALYARMSERGITMIDAIQGPPRWAGPDVLLRQTSFRALAEPRQFRDPDGSVTEGSLRVRFGEVEARGIALTRRGRARYDQAVATADAGGVASVWAEYFPGSETELFTSGLGVYTVRAVTDRAGAGDQPRGSVEDLIRDGWLRADPVVYEDFLPRSAAGIFQSNLTDAGSKDVTADGADLGAEWLEGVLDRKLNDPFDLYEEQHRSSVRHALHQLGATPVPTT